MNCVLLKMGGNGVRFGAGIPKQFYEIHGEPLFAYVLKKYAAILCIDKFVIVTNAEWRLLTESYARKILGDKLIGIVCGGDTNMKSTYNGIIYAEQFLKGEDILLVHDVTDPIVNEQAVRDVIKTAEKEGCSAVVTEQVHTLYKKDTDGYIAGTIEKNMVGSGYSPEAFKFSIVRNCFHSASDAELNAMTSAMALVQSKGIKARTVVSHQVDLKITYREDMKALLMLIENGEKLYQE